MLRLEIILLLTFFCFSFSPPISTHSSSTDSSITIHESIHPITGDYTVFEKELICNGYEPIYFTRCYTSSSQEGKEAKWTLFAHLYLYIERPDDQKKEKTKIRISEETGTLIVYQNTLENPLEFQPLLGKKSKGITNTSREEISSKTNLANYKLIKNKEEGCYILFAADGSRRYYKKVHGTDFGYLEKERKPNGNWVIYEYNEDYFTLKKIRTTNPSQTKIYAEASFLYEGKAPSFYKNFLIKKDKEAVLKCIFDKEKEDESTYFRLQHVVSKQSPLHTYHYEVVDETSTSLLKERKLEQQTVATITYYNPGENLVGEEKVKIKKAEDPIERRIKSLDEPVGKDNALHTTHRLFYNLGQYAKKEGVKVFNELSHDEGYTICYDIYNQKTVYAFNSFFIPLYTCKYGRENGVETLLYKELFEWDFDGKINKLSSKTIFDKDKPFSKRIYEYDTLGNVIKETLLANLTGQGWQDCQEKENPLWDRYTITSDYDHHRLTKKTFPNGLSYEFRYVEDTDLVFAKYILDRGLILFREFYEYNEDYILVKITKDNGKHYLEERQEGITEKHVTSITLSPLKNSLNLPSQIIEYSLDPKDKTLKLLSKKNFLYNDEALVIQEDLFNQDDILIGSIQKTYDDKCRLVASTDIIGRTSSITYNSLNQIVEEKTATSTAHIHHTKDLLGNTLILSAEYPSGKIDTFSLEYDLKKRVVSTQDHKNNIQLFAYNDLDFEIKTELSSILTPEKTLFTPIIQTERDFKGRALKITDPDGHVTTYTYNHKGLPTTITHPNGSKESIVYTLDGLIKEAVDRSGKTTYFDYDCLGREIKKEIFSDQGSLLESLISYYQGSRLFYTLNHYNVKTSYQYDVFGRTALIKQEKEGRILSYETFSYDDLGNLTIHCIHNIEDVSKKKIHQRLYNLLSQLIEENVMDETGLCLQSTKYSYDVLGRKISTKHMSLYKDIEETFAYDEKGRVVEYKNSNDKHIFTSYEDGIFNPLTKTLETLITITQGSEKTRERYNSLDQLVEKSCYLEDKLNSQSRFFYNFKGLVIRQEHIQYNDGVSFCNQIVNTSYDCFDRPLFFEKISGDNCSQTHHVYDNCDRLTSIQFPDGKTLTYEYNDKHQLARVYSSDQTIDYSLEYDVFGRVTKENNLLEQCSVEKTYNPHNLVERETFLNGFKVEKRWDGFSRATRIEIDHGGSIDYDYSTSFCHSVTRKTQQGECYTHTYLPYDGFTKETKQTVLEGKTILKKYYENSGRLCEVSSPYFSQKILSKDKDKNIQSLLTKEGFTEYTSYYGYDDKSQLIFERGLFLIDYDYDALRNRSSKNHTPLQYENFYDLMSDGTFVYSYNQEGLRIEKSYGSQSLHYRYDVLKRLISCETDSTKLSFVYDLQDRRLAKKTEKKLDSGLWALVDIEFYFYDESEEIGSYNRENTLRQLKVLGRFNEQEISQSIFLELKSTTFIPLYDLCGNIVCIVDAATQKVAESYAFSTFGQELIFDALHRPIQQSEQDNPWRYQGKRIDEETLLILFGRRFYDPFVGRWLTPDPLGLSEGIHPTLYLENNPLKYIDREGLEAEEWDEVDPKPWNNRPYSLTPVNQTPYDNTPFATEPQRFDYQPNVYPSLSDIRSRFYNPYTSTRISEWTELQHHEQYRFFFINGINTNLDEAKNMRSKCVDFLGARVDLFYNKSRNCIEDAALVMNVHRNRQLQIVEDLRSCLLHETTQGKEVFIFAHSCGGGITYNAFMQLPSASQEKVHIITFGSAKFLPKVEKNHVINYISKHDAVALSSNIMHEVISRNFSEKKNPRFKQTPIITLEPKSHSILQEHAFLGSTYQEALKHQCEHIKKHFLHTAFSSLEPVESSSSAR